MKVTKNVEDSLPIEVLQKGFIITDEEIKNNPTLKLTVNKYYYFNSLYLQETEGDIFSNKSFEINARGITPSLRGGKDGISIFGVNFPDNKEYLPDVRLNLPEEKIKKIKKQNIFLIYYRKDLQKFYLEPVFDNKEVFFVFVKMTNPYLLTTETMAFCVLSYIFKIKVNNNNKKELLIEYGTNENLSQVEFNCDKKTEFYIGRKQDADIEITESQVSREQAMIYYEKGNWYIKDGGKEKPSGSGTWLFLDKKYEIKSDLIFMVGSSTIKLEYILPGNNEKIEEKKETNNIENKENKENEENKDNKENQESRESKENKEK